MKVFRIFQEFFNLQFLNFQDFWLHFWLKFPISWKKIQCHFHSWTIIVSLQFPDFIYFASTDRDEELARIAQREEQRNYMQQDQV